MMMQTREDIECCVRALHYYVVNIILIRPPQFTVVICDTAGGEILSYRISTINYFSTTTISGQFARKKLNSRSATTKLNFSQFPQKVSRRRRRRRSACASFRPRMKCIRRKALLCLKLSIFPTETTDHSAAATGS